MSDFIFFAQTAAEGVPGAAANPMGSLIQTVLPFVAMIVLFYVMLILPENKRRKKLEKEKSEMKQGDKVITSGGVHGTVDFINDANKTVYIKTLDTKMEISRESIIAIVKNK